MSANRLSVVLGASILWMCLAAAAEPLEPNTLLQQLQSTDAQAVVRKLTDAQWNFILNKVETGKRQWLTVAATLHRHTDAGESEMLTLAMGKALRRNPTEVLRIVTGEVTAKEICGYPDMTESDTNSKEKVAAYLDSRIAAVEAVSEKALIGRRNECLEIMRETRREVMSTSGPFSR
jgi:hypothetical protein